MWMWLIFPQSPCPPASFNYKASSDDVKEQILHHWRRIWPTCYNGWVPHFLIPPIRKEGGGTSCLAVETEIEFLCCSDFQRCHVTVRWKCQPNHFFFFCKILFMFVIKTSKSCWLCLFTTQSASSITVKDTPLNKPVLKANTQWADVLKSWLSNESRRARSNLSTQVRVRLSNLQVCFSKLPPGVRSEKNRLSERGPGCERDLLVCCWSVSLASTESKTKPHSKGGKVENWHFSWGSVMAPDQSRETGAKQRGNKFLESSEVGHSLCWLSQKTSEHLHPSRGLLIYLLTCWGLGVYSVACLLCFSVMCFMFDLLPFFQASLWDLFKLGRGMGGAT